MQNGTYNSKRKETMSIVQSYILGHNFTKDHSNIAVRPPTIGEEHEAVSISSHSSVSGKSEVSTATPRRTDMDLGYEPEGSASPLPAYERWKLSLYNMLEDSEGVNAFRRFLIRSKQESILECWLAMKGFKNFDNINRNSGNSSASSSTTGSMSQASAIEQMEKRIKLAKKIYKTYMTSGAPKSISTVVKDATKQYIMSQIKLALKNKAGADLDSDLFHQAQTEIELNVESNSYKKFLASNEFSQYAAQCDSLSAKVANSVQSNLSQSPRTTQSSAPSTSDDPSVLSTTESTSATSQPYLPRLDENQVWSPPKDARQRTTASANGMRLTSESLAKTAICRSMSHKHASFERTSVDLDHSNMEKRAAFPYFTPSGYRVPPASAIGSDQASKSSDATSDTLSFTDNSSVDGMATYSCGRSGQKRQMRNQVKKNPANALPECVGFVQRTSRMKGIPANTNLAGTDPLAFFRLLEKKLLDVIEERKAQQQKLIANARAKSAELHHSAPPAGPAIKGDDEDMEKMLDNHLAWAMPSPGGRHSPPNSGTRRRQAMSSDPFYGQQNVNPSVGGQTNNALQHKRKEAGVIVGLVPGMPQNEVPDVDTPVDPVDKNKMITAWIQTPQTQTQPRSRKSQKNRRFTAPGVETVPENVPYVHPAESTGLQSSTTNQVYRKLQPLAQDPAMPPFDQPDADTTIEEVKRRLMAETDGSYEDIIPDLASLNVSPSTMANMRAPPTDHLPVNSNPSLSTSSSKPQKLPEDVTNPTAQAEQDSDSDSSTETATFSNMNNTSSGGTQKTSANASDYLDNNTTVVYYLPHEPVAYKVHIPHSPLTLRLFKNYLSKKGNYKYFFKQYSVELQRPVFFEVATNDEELPRWEGIVLAKIEPCL
ncbi:unnamed protein product [Clavelina lepadiformis]|uniref:Axin n=2 Tax=Clavelina lepadiformis TaxID=159417 RepID=A0ABP0GFR9_CLALP